MMMSYPCNKQSERAKSMSTASKPLSEAVLSRLTNEALTSFLGEAAFYEAAARPGLQLALSNEPVADLNMLHGPNKDVATPNHCGRWRWLFGLFHKRDVAVAIDRSQQYHKLAQKL